MQGGNQQPSNGQLISAWRNKMNRPGECGRKIGEAQHGPRPGAINRCGGEVWPRGLSPAGSKTSLLFAGQWGGGDLYSKRMGLKNGVGMGVPGKHGRGRGQRRLTGPSEISESKTWFPSSAPQTGGKGPERDWRRDWVRRRILLSPPTVWTGPSWDRPSRSRLLSSSLPGHRASARTA